MELRKKIENHLEKIKKRKPVEELKVEDFPKSVLKRVLERFESDEEILRVLKLYRKPKSKQCCCKTNEFVVWQQFGGGDCWLCQGYTY